MTLKPITKTLWLLIGAALLIGAGLAGLGRVLGAHSNVYVDRAGIHAAGGWGADRDQQWVNGASAESADFEPSAIDRISIGVYSADVRFVPAENGKLTYRIEQDESAPELTATVTGTTLTIGQKDRFRWNLFSWGSIASARVIIAVPQSLAQLPDQPQAQQQQQSQPQAQAQPQTQSSPAQLTEININTASGSTRIDAPLACQQFTFKAASGDLSGTQNLRAKDVMVQLASGDVRLTSLDASNNARFSVASGNITVQALKAGSLGVDVVSGDLKIAGDITGDIGLHLVSGDVKLALASPAAAYNKTVHKTSGQVTFGAKEAANNYRDQHGAAATINVEVVSGDVNVQFAD